MEDKHISKFKITLILEPEGETKIIPCPRSVMQLLNRLKLSPSTVLVIREGELLTSDRRISPGDTITVRSVVSMG